MFSKSKPTCHFLIPCKVLLLKWIVFTLGLPERKASWCVVRADKSWAEAEWLTDSSCMQRWVASAGFTLLAFACLQLAWCSCQPVIDEYHHLKCKRKRLCEGRHDEVPPAGALRDTLGASSSLSLFPTPLLFSTSLPPCPSLYPFLPLMLLFLHLLFFFMFESLSASPAVSSSSMFLPLLSSCTLFLSHYCPHDFHFCPPSLIQAYLTGFCCVTLRSNSFTVLHSSTFPALHMSICLVEKWGSPQKQPVFSSVYNPCCLLYFSDHMKCQNSYRSWKAIYLVSACCIPPQ